MAVDELVISACGDGKSCNGEYSFTTIVKHSASGRQLSPLLAHIKTALWDKALSTVSIPAEIANAPRDNPSDPEVIESACYSRLAEPYMIDKYKDDEEFWSKYEVQPSWTYFLVLTMASSVRFQPLSKRNAASTILGADHGSWLLRVVQKMLS